ncbi:polymeric immunoglobulin receptor-like [Astyanax mexicanus]|nr:polymeric immunoglobulin receptor-like [Astyanax mexicanus]
MEDIFECLSLELISTEEAGFGVKFCFFSAGSESMKTLKHLTVRRGGSLTVPCLYNKEHKSHCKYWCKGGTWSSCRIVAYANTNNTGISITDHPSQNMFTVDLKKLQDSDSGWYWCVVEIGGYWTPDVRDSVYLTVSSDPAVWVENSRVIGQEGGGVSVQGFYSSGYKNEEKKWCRFKTWSCYPFQDSTVKISDDKNNRSFRVEMIGLQKSDAGWYWFSAGLVGVTVHLTVTERPTSKMILISEQKRLRLVDLGNPCDLVLISTEEAGFGVKFCFFSAGSESMKTLKRLTVRRGGSLTVPCLYEEEYKSHPKYWCEGEHWSLCTIVAYANSSSTGISVTDHPSQNMFTVDLKKLQDSDSGWYWCAVEIDGAADVRDYVNLTVSSDPAVWVENSRVIGQEGGRVSVQGFYSSEYKNGEKKWCRVKTWSCYPFQNSTVKISDDKNRRSFRVEMIGLQESDAGWYWFSAGDVGVTVHLTVTERPTTTVTSTTGKSEKPEAPTNPSEETTTCGSGKPIELLEFCMAQN